MYSLLFVCTCNNIGGILSIRTKQEESFIESTRAQIADQEGQLYSPKRGHDVSVTRNVIHIVTALTPEFVPV